MERRKPAKKPTKKPVNRFVELPERAIDRLPEDLSKYKVTTNNQKNTRGLTISTYVEDHVDHIYLNILMNNNTSGLLPLTYFEDRLQPLLKNPSDYYLTIARANIPMFAVPIQFFVPNRYSVTMTYTVGGVTYTSNNIYLQMIVQEYLSPALIGSYQQFIDMINVALSAAFTDLSAQVTGAGQSMPANTSAPYMTYNAQTLLTSLIATISYATNPLKIYFNTKLYDNFGNYRVQTVPNTTPITLSVNTNGTTTLASPTNSFTAALDGASISGLGIPPNTNVHFATPGVVTPGTMIMSNAATSTLTGTPVTFYAGKDELFIIENTFNNGTYYKNNGTATGAWTAYEMKQEFVALYNMNDFNNLVIQSNNIPIRGESVPAITHTALGPNGDTSVTGNTSVIQFNPNTLSNQQILTDLVPSISQGPDLFSNLNYFPQGPYRIIDLVSTSPLTKLDLTILWQDNRGVQHPLYIQGDRFASVKLLFIKKTAMSKDSFF